MTTMSGLEPAELAITQSMYAPPMRPLSERNRARVFVLREGALDYRAIPSLCANERVPFKHCINTVDEVAQG